MSTTPTWVVQPAPPSAPSVVADVWRYRHLLGFIGGRAFRKIYRRTVLGWLWLFIIPLFPLALRTLVFGGLLGVASNGVPYFLFLAAGTVGWDFFSAALVWGTRGLEMNRGLAGQVYLPRALMPLGNMAPAFLDLAIKVVVFALALAWYSWRDGRSYLPAAVPFAWAMGALATILLLAAAITLFTSVLGEKTRDMRFGLAQVLGVWYLATPVLYPLSEVPEAGRAWMLLNPMTPLIETIRWGLVGAGEFDAGRLGMSAAFAAALFMAGLVFFVRAQIRVEDDG